MTRILTRSLAAIVVAAALAASLTVSSASAQPAVSDTERDAAAQAIAQHCRALLARMQTLAADARAAGELRDVAETWRALRCDQALGVEPDR